MTVKELIEELLKLPNDLEVCYIDGDYSLTEAQETGPPKVVSGRYCVGGESKRGEYVRV